MNKVSHLGCTLESNNSMKSDISLKRGKFIGKVHSLMQEFHFASKDVLMKLIDTYTTSFCGSPLWDPLSADCDRIYRSWNVTIRNIFGVDRTTHRYLIEPLSKSLHPKVMLLSRLDGFYKAQLKSPKMTVRFLIKIAENDKRTVLGRTLDFLCVKCGLKATEVDKLIPHMVKSKMDYMEIPKHEQWRIPMIEEVLRIREGSGYIPGFTSTEVDEILLNICCS